MEVIIGVVAAVGVLLIIVIIIIVVCVVKKRKQLPTSITITFKQRNVASFAPLEPTNLTHYQI